MPFRLLCLVLLISCASQTVHSGGITDRLTYDEELQGTVKQEPPVHVIFSSVTFSFGEDGSGETILTLKFCSDAVLVNTAEGEALKDSVSLTYGVENEEEVIPDGIIDGDMKCAKFTGITAIVPFPSELMTYDITFVVSNGPLNDVTKQGAVIFAMTVSANTVECGTGNHVIRAEWITNNDYKPTIVQCPGFPDGQNPCYVDGDLSQSDLCFTIAKSSPDTLTNICIGGINLISAIADPNQFQVNYLLYGAAPEGSLSIPVAGTPDSFEAIIQKDQGTPYILCSVQSPTDGKENCAITGFEQGTSTYTVCSIVKKNDGSADSFTTAVSYPITDMDVNAYKDTTNNLLQFRFANENPKKNYVAFLYDSAEIQDTSVNLDCTALEEGSTCYGFIHIESVASATHFVVGWAPEDVGDDITNKIAYPYPAISSSNMFHTL